MVEYLRTDVAPGGPGRRDDKRYPVAQSHGCSARVFLAFSFRKFLFERRVFYTWVNAGGTFAAVFLIGIGRNERWNVVKVAVVFVVRHNQDGLPPDVRIF